MRTRAEEIPDWPLILSCSIYNPVILLMGEGVGLNPDNIYMTDDAHYLSSTPGALESITDSRKSLSGR